MESYINGEKELSVDNVLNSVSEVLSGTVTGGITNLATGAIAGNIPALKTNPGWFRPKKFISSLTGKYAVRVWGQMAVEGGLGIVENVVLSVPQPTYASVNTYSSKPIARTTVFTQRSTGKHWRVTL